MQFPGIQRSWEEKERLEVLVLFMASLKRSVEEMEGSTSLNTSGESSATPTPAAAAGSLKLEGPLPMLCVLDLDKTVSHHLPTGIDSCRTTYSRAQDGSYFVVCKFENHVSAFVSGALGRIIWRSTCASPLFLSFKGANRRRHR